MKSICFLKNKSSNDSNYTNIFKSYATHFYNLLNFNYINTESLYSQLLNHNNYEVYINRPRSLEAITNISSFVDLLIPWKSKSIYVVGSNCALLCKNLNIIPHSSYNDNTTSSDIIQYLLKYTEKPYLYLCGNIRLDEFPNSMIKNNINFKELIVYETIPLNILDNIPECEWYVFFSPSGVDTIKNYGNIKGKFAAIGKTTASALLDAGLNCDAIASKPNAESLLNAIELRSNE